MTKINTTIHKKKGETNPVPRPRNPPNPDANPFFRSIYPSSWSYGSSGRRNRGQNTGTHRSIRTPSSANARGKGFPRMSLGISTTIKQKQKCNIEHATKEIMLGEIDNRRRGNHHNKSKKADRIKQSGTAELYTNQPLKERRSCTSLRQGTQTVVVHELSPTLGFIS